MTSKAQPERPPSRIVFNVFIPHTDDRTGLVHAPGKIEEWGLATAERFGGVTLMGRAILGLWYDDQRPADENPVEDHSDWYKVAVQPEGVAALYAHVEDAAREFGQKCIYLERAGEADFVKNPTYED